MADNENCCNIFNTNEFSPVYSCHCNCLQQHFFLLVFFLLVLCALLMHTCANGIMHVCVCVVASSRFHWFSQFIRLIRLSIVSRELHIYVPLSPIVEAAVQSLSLSPLSFSLCASIFLLHFECVPFYPSVSYSIHITQLHRLHFD